MTDLAGIAPDPPSTTPATDPADTVTTTTTWRARYGNGPWTHTCDTRQAALNALETTP